jgi:hypothetical protein
MTREPETILVQIPFRITKRGGRKRMVTPDGSALPQAREQPDSALVKALARAFRWKHLIESGEFATINDLAANEGIAPSYMTRVMRMTLLAPETIEAIVEGNQGPEITLARVLEPFPVEWAAQLPNYIQKTNSLSAPGQTTSSR